MPSEALLLWSGSLLALGVIVYIVADMGQRREEKKREQLARRLRRK